jgi:hypothetical protein
MHNY